MITIIVVLCVVAYAIMVGFTFQFLMARMSGYDKEFPATFGAIAWPLILPIAFGKRLARSLDPRDKYGEKLTRDGKRRQRELDAAKHEEELARVRLREAQYTEEAIAIARGEKTKSESSVEFGRW